jgi:CheY-like chemotaxis protein
MTRRILAVDDDRDMLEYLRVKLGNRCELVTTTEAAKVIELARKHRPDLILCDVDMPDMDGGEISVALLGDDELRDIPLIFLTSLATPEDLARSSGQLGGRRALSKSAPVDELVAVILAHVP